MSKNVTFSKEMFQVNFNVGVKLMRLSKEVLEFPP